MIQKPKKLDMKDCGSKGSQSFECQWGGYNCRKIHLSAQKMIQKPKMLDKTVGPRKVRALNVNGEAIIVEKITSLLRVPY